MSALTSILRKQCVVSH